MSMSSKVLVTEEAWQLIILPA